MSTTYSNNFGIKLIGTGLEKTSWGESTNENFKRLEAGIGGSTAIDVFAMPLNSTSASTDGVTAATWLTVDNRNQGLDGSEGRNQVVAVNGASAAADITLEIRGASSGVTPDRVLIVENNLGNGHSLILDGGGASTVTVSNGKSVIVAVRSTTDSPLQSGVNNLASDLEFNSVTTAALVTFLNAGTLSIQDSDADALIIAKGATRLLSFDTTDDTVTVDSGRLAFNTAGDIIAQATNNASAIDITDETDSFAVVDTRTGAKRLVLGSTNVVPSIGNAVLDLTSSAKSIDIANAEASSLVIEDVTGADEYVEFDTVAQEVNVLQAATFANSLRISETDGYVNMNDTVGSAGIGFRSVSDVLQFKSTGDSWADLVLKTLATPSAASAQPGGGADSYQFAVDIGPLRFIMNTIQIDADPAVTITLGDLANGTDHSMASTLYNVIAVSGGPDPDTANCAAWVSDSALGTFALKGTNGSEYYTYIAIGDN